MRIYYFLNRHSSDHRFSVIARFFSKRFSPSLPRSWKIFKDYKTINLDTDRIERSFRWNEKIEIVGKSNRNAKCVQTYILIHALVAFVKGTSVWIRTNSQRNNRFFWIFWNLDPHSVLSPNGNNIPLLVDFIPSLRKSVKSSRAEHDSR